VRSSRSSWFAGAALVLLATSVSSAHRRDEYLQTARVAVDPDHVGIELDLTPGIAVAADVLAAIDRDGSRSISEGEAQAYRRQVLDGLAIDIDGTPLSLELVNGSVPEVDAVLNGEGTMRLYARAALPRLAPGTHHLHYRNSHRPDIGVYLVNALVPASERVAVVRQRRDVDQRDVTIEYTLAADLATRALGALAAAVAGAAIWLAARWRRRAIANSSSLIGCR
jgi:hypothetical protein